MVQNLNKFLENTRDVERGNEKFELETDHLLQVNLDGTVWMKHGAMVAYTGQIKFEREKVLEHGLGKALKKAFTGEGASLTKAHGKGRLYLAELGKNISAFDLAGGAITVNGNDLLAFDETIKWDIKMMRKLAALASGGLFNVTLQGNGMVAITTHHDPVTLPVTPERPIYTDPNATVAWSADLQPNFKTDMSFRTFIGRSSGESYQMEFIGKGFVIIQPYEEVYYSGRQ